MNRVSVRREPVRVLYAAFDPGGAKLTQRHFEAHAPHLRLEIVETAAQLLQRLPGVSSQPCGCDVVLLDSQTGGENLLRLLECIRAERGLDLPVVVIADPEDDALPGQALERGASDTVVKQTNYLHTLSAVVENVHHRFLLAREREALGETVARLRVIIDTEPECVKVVGPDGQLQEMNRAGLRMLEADSLADLQQRTILDYVVPEHRQAFVALHKRVMAGETGILEFEVVGLEGTRRWLETHAAPLRNAAGVVVGLLGVTRDVAERKLGEQRLRESEARYRSLFEGAPDGILVADSKGRYTDANPSALGMLGYSREELIGRESAAILAPKEHARVDRALSEINRGFEHRNEWQFLRKDGSTFSADVMATVMADGRILALVRDASGRKAMEERLRQSEEKFSKAFQSSPDSLVMSSLTDGRIIEVNDAFARLSGHSRDEALGRTTVDLGLWVSVAERDVYRAALQGGTGIREMASQFRSKSGSLLDGLVSGEVIRLGDERVALTTIRDVTDRKRADEERSTLEAQLRQSQKMEAIGRLAGGVAHDFNNMLAVILGHADLALPKLRPIDPIFKTLRAIRDAAQRSADLTRQLLAFSRQQAIAPRVLDLNIQIAGMEALLQRIIGEDIELRLALAPDPWSVSLDPSQVDQILANLAVNSRDAMPDGGKLTVETANVRADDGYCARHPGARPGDYFMLAVSDTGVGMDDATRERAFEPFFTTKPEGKGTGLGLATIYGIVKQNAGFVDVYSEVGQGTAIRLHFPRSTAVAEAAPPAAMTPAPARGHETILLVEDQGELRELARTVLQQLGYSVLSAAGAGEALTLCEKHPGEIHLLFTDVVMPLMNGKELAERIRVMKPNIRILFTSGYTADTIGHRGVLDPGVHFLEKPFVVDSLARKVREVLGASG